MVRHNGRGDFRLELVRKAAHALVGVTLTLLIANGFLDVWLLAFLTALFGAIVLYNARFEIELLSRVLGVNRADATIPGLDILAYLIGCLLVVALFPLPIALAAILVLAIGDPLAHLFGTGFGGRSAMVTENSYIWGMVAGTIGGTFAAWTHVFFLPALLAAAAAMFVEAGEVRLGSHHLDDNLTIPLVAGFVLWLLLALGTFSGLELLKPF